MRMYHFLSGGKEGIKNQDKNSANKGNIHPYKSLNVYLLYLRLRVNSREARALPAFFTTTFPALTQHLACSRNKSLTDALSFNMLGLRLSIIFKHVVCGYQACSTVRAQYDLTSVTPRHLCNPMASLFPQVQPRAAGD